jgi:serine/threonine-protein kinase RsbW
MTTVLNFDLTVPSRLELVDDLCERVSHFLNQLGFAQHDVYAFDLSIREAVVNAMKHGNGLDPGLTVSVGVQISHDKCTIRIGDSGKDPKATPESRADLLAPDGRGLLIMRSFMDSVEFVRSRNRFEVILSRHHRQNPIG